MKTARIIVLIITVSCFLAPNKTYASDPSHVWSTYLDGSGVEDLVAGAGLLSARGIDLDFESGKIYWADAGTSKIQSSNLDGSSITDIVSGLNLPGGLTIFKAICEPPCWQEKAKLTASDGAAVDFFGIDISISGDYAIIGADGDDDRGNWSGSAYIFKLEGESWIEQTKLTASDGAAGDRFGLRVSMSGDYAIVGAHNNDHYGSNSGSAYIFKRSNTPGDLNWYQQAKLVASDGVSLDNFGFSVSISGDYVIIGAHGDDNKTGSAYIFKRSNTPGDPNWYEQCKLIAPDRAAGDYFGISVSLSGDYSIVGAELDDDKGTNSGTAYIFNRSDTPGDPNWYQVSKLTASDGTAGDTFGGNVAISSDYAIVGATGNDANELVDSGAAYIFKRSDVPGDPNWYEQAKLTASDGASSDGFGNRVYISDDYAVIPAYADDTNGLENTGSAYIFKRDGTSWIEQAKLTASDAAAHDVFGIPAISGNLIMIGSPRDDDNGTDSGSAYVFENTCEVACEASFQGLGDLDGGSFWSSAYAVSSDGSVVVGYSISASGDEAFRWTSDSGMVGLGDLPGGSFDSYAWGVSADGSVIVGKSNSGAGSEAFHWCNNVMTGLGYLSGYSKLYSDGMDVSNDGFFIVGESHSGLGYQAFRWEDINRNGIADNNELLDGHPEFGLGDLSGGIFYSSACGISADSSVVVGWGHSTLGQEAFHWTETTGMTGLGDLSGGIFQSIGMSSSAKGSVVVGYSSSALGTEAFRWEDLNGNGVVDPNEKLDSHPEFGLGDLPGGNFHSEALAVSADGSVVVGWGSSVLGKEAFIWDKYCGMRNLKDVLENEYELDLTGWTLIAARGISDDGLTIVGEGINPDGNTEAWIAKICKENVPPKADAGKDQTVFVGTDCLAEVILDGSGSSDPDGDKLTYSWTWVINGQVHEDNGVNPTIVLPLGQHTITLIVNDGIEDSEPDEVVTTVLDNTPPELSLSVDPNVLWPPNHKMVLITPSWIVNDNCDESPQITLVNITMNEGDETNTYDPAYDNTQGDGHTLDDIQVIDGNIYLRAERSGKGTGRVYTITYQAADDSGNVTPCSATVTVPHDQQ